MSTLFGIRLITHPLLEGMKKPVLRIRDDVPCSEPTRSEVNRYLLETFGENEIAISTGTGEVFMSPKHTAMLLLRRE